MALPTPPRNTDPIPNSPFYSPESFSIEGSYSPLIVGDNLDISNEGTISATGGVTALIAGTGISLSAPTGIVTISATAISVPSATPTVEGILFGISNCDNTAVGLNTLRLTTGTGNTAIGERVLYYNTTGFSNTAVGEAALFYNTNGGRNTAIGREALFYNTDGCYNIAIGHESLYNTTTGCANTAIGYSAGCNITTGGCNVAVGYCAQVASPSGSCQLAIGFSATENWLTGDSTKAIKPGAGIIDCAGVTGTAGQVLMSDGANAICWGTAGGGGSSPATPTVQGILYGLSNPQNTAVGYNALLCNTTGSYNTAHGRSALHCNTEGRCNVAIGTYALCCNLTGCSNVASGFSTLRNNTSGRSNVASGGYALGSNTNGCCNVAVGVGALFSNTCGCHNTAIGTYALYSHTTGCYNVALGCGVEVASPTGSCQLAIGFRPNCNWLTGDSTKAIKPGAGIIDCAGSCGGAGQSLTSTGSNAVLWAVPAAVYGTFTDSRVTVAVPSGTSNNAIQWNCTLSSNLVQLTGGTAGWVMVQCSGIYTIDLRMQVCNAATGDSFGYTHFLLLSGSTNFWPGSMSQYRIYSCPTLVGTVTSHHMLPLNANQCFAVVQTSTSSNTFLCCSSYGSQGAVQPAALLNVALIGS